MFRGYAAAISRGTIFLAVLLFAFARSTFAADPAVEKYEPKAPQSMHQPKQSTQSLEEQALKKFERMCEFIQLEGEQLNKARGLFNSRIEEIQKINGAAQRGEMSQPEARQKLVESFKNHREQFESLLSKEQIARLKKYEKNRPNPEGGEGRS